MAYKVKVTGQYIARSPHSEKEKIKKNYEVEGVIPSLASALSVVKNKLLGPALAKKYPDYVAFLTHHIINITPLDETSRERMTKTEIAFMNRETLLRYIKENALPVDAAFYPDVLKLREAVQDAKEDPEGYQKRFALKKDDLVLDMQMQALNADLFEDTPKPDAVVLSALADAPRPKKTKEDISRQTTDRLKGLKADMIRDGELTDLPDDL